MNTFLIILGTMAIMVNSMIAYTANLGLPEDLYIAGYLGMAMNIAFTLIPAVCVAAANEWRDHYA